MKKNLKILIVFIGCLLVRLIPFRAPNVEPIMASIMPIGKKYGIFFSFLFGFLSVFIYDLMTNFGIWTMIAGVTYGLIGIVASIYFRKFKTNISNFVIFSILATIVFDLITGVLFAPVFNQTIYTAFLMQIPFTALHLAGNILLSLVLSPLVLRFFATEKSFVFNKKLQQDSLVA